MAGSAPRSMTERAQRWFRAVTSHMRKQAVAYKLEEMISRPVAAIMWRATRFTLASRGSWNWIR